jgi:hypothetical protein
MNNPIWAPKEMYKSACCKIPYKGYEISIAMDDSCGAFEQYNRSDIRIFRDWDGKDVTYEFFRKQGIVSASADTLKEVFANIDMFGDRD